MRELTFDLVCKQLRKNKGYGDIIENISVLSGAAIVLLGVRGASGDISAFVNALAIKEELINTSKYIIEKIIKNKTNEYDERLELIQWSYSIIYYTSFFDVLDEKLPVNIRKSIELKVGEKEHIFTDAVASKHQKRCGSSDIDEYVFFPNISCNYSEVEERLLKLYLTMSDGLRQFVDMLSFKETNEERVVGEFEAIIKEIPKYAINRFKSQYLYLASHFNEFYVYMQIKGNQRTEKKLEQIYEKIVLICEMKNNNIDIGLQELRSIMLNLPEKIEEERVNRIVDSLLEKYQTEIEKPIIDSNMDDEKLQYPSIKEAFIPQSYKIINYTGHEHLENKKTWEGCDILQDMDSFWAQYLYHPESFYNLLLILGEPGGGKSLLTKILSARMITNNNVVIRIPLRDINVENEIEAIICEQLQKDGDAVERISTFKWFSEHFKKNPITIIFDGYDEVLQATGGIYKTFLKKISKFQFECKEKHRPIRIIVTSRETLIDKAELPIGTIVMKLLEFNNHQRSRWIEVWNKYNKDVYEIYKINPFTLPIDNISIEEISRQPLLLLMLAIYDANIEDGINSLGQNSVISRTTLYNELLCRFIRRELKKGARGKEVEYEELETNEQEEMINCELERLGIAALGMYIRGKLSLQVKELESDLITMEVNLPLYDNCRKLLSQAEILFGSFFFIHDSQSGNVDDDNKNIAFEFLHKTFYEFLVADLILKYLIKEMNDLNELRLAKNKKNYYKALDDPNHLGKQFYLTLIYTHLCAEPEILEMIVEWKDNLLGRRFEGNREEFETTMCELFQKQVEIITNEILLPDVWKENNYNFNEKKSYLQYCAMFLMNLLILQISTDSKMRCVLKNDKWRYLSLFWKMNIDEEILLKFTAIFNVVHKENQTIIKKKGLNYKIDNKSKLVQTIELSNFLQDDVKFSLAKLHSSDLKSKEKSHCYTTLASNGIDLDFEMLLIELYHFTMIQAKRKIDISRYIEECCNILRKQTIDPKLFIDWLLYIDLLIDENHDDRRNYKYIRDLLLLTFKQFNRYNRIIILVCKIVCKLGQNKNDIYMIIDLMSDETTPDIYLLILKNINISKDIFFSNKLTKRIIEYCEINLKNYPMETIEIISITKIYKSFEIVDILLNYTSIREILHKIPIVILNILKSLERVEKYYFFITEVETYFDLDFYYLIKYYPEISIEIVMFFVKLNFEKNACKYIDRVIIYQKDIIRKSTKAMILLLELMICARYIDEIKEIKYEIMRRFNDIMYKNMEFILHYFIIIYQNGEHDEELFDNLIRFFDSILINHDNISIFEISILIDSLDEYSKQKLGVYWSENHLFFEMNCPEIADVVNEFYDINL